MKICIFSDSHGYPDNMIRAVEREKPALCFFLGDGERDLTALSGRFPSLPVYAVRGNCDLRSRLPQQLLCAVGGVKIFAVHGHLHQVKYDPSLTELRDAAGEAAVLLYGHTHRAGCERRDGKILLNPGTVGRVARPSFGLLELDGEEMRAEILYL